MISPTLRSPSTLGACLDDLLGSRFLPKRWVGRVWSVSDLPRQLQYCANLLLPDTEWRAYSDDDQLLFAVARPHIDDMEDAPGTAIEVYFLDASAAVYAAGVWQHNLKNGWWLDSLLDLSYDCDHGWWLDRVMQPPAPAVVGFKPHTTNSFEAPRLQATWSRREGIAASKAPRSPKIRT